jgi:hypothetical protein
MLANAVNPHLLIAVLHLVMMPFWKTEKNDNSEYLIEVNFGLSLEYY